MTDAPRYATLRDYLRVVRSQRVLIALITLAFVGAAVALAVRADPVYEATAALAFSDERSDFQLTGDAALPTQSPEQRAAVFSETLNTIELATRVQERTELDMRPQAIRSAITLRAEARTNLVIIEARTGDAELAATLANAYAAEAETVATREAREEFGDAARNLRAETRDLENTPENRFARQINQQTLVRLRTLERIADPADVAERAEVPGEPVSPQPIRNGLLGLLLGLSIAVLVAFVRDALDRRLRTAHDIREELKLPIVGYIRDETLGRPVGGTGVKGGGLDNEDLEAFRILRTNLDFLDVDQPITRVLVTSGLPEEGKSTVSASLACAYVMAGKRTLLVECDLRRPTLAARYGLDAKPGLADYLVGEAQPGDVLQTLPMTLTSSNGSAPQQPPSDAPALVCITAGTPSPRPAELLGSQRFAAFLDQVGKAYDVVVLDSSPLLSVVDTLELLPRVDGVLVCVRASQTTRDQAHAAKAALEHFPSRPTGVVVTGLRPGDDADYGYYSYSYAYGASR